MKRILAVILAIFMLDSIHSSAQNAGDLDISFGIGGIVVTEFEEYEIELNHFSPDGIKAVFTLEDGKILCVGTADNGKHFISVRYNENGSIDETYGVDGFVIVEDLGRATCADLNGNNDLIIGGFNDNGQIVLLKLKYSGEVDSSFGEDGIVISDLETYLGIDGLKAEVYNVSIQNDFKIVIVGNIIIPATDSTTDLSKIFIARYLSDGSMDDSFNDDGIFTILELPYIHENVFDLEIFNDNSIIICGHLQYNPSFLKIKNAGYIDSSFATNGILSMTYYILSTPSLGGFTSLEITSDEKLIATGIASPTMLYTNKIILSKIHDGGEMDLDFGIDGIMEYSNIDSPNNENNARSILIQDDNKLLVSGYRSFYVGSQLKHCFYVARFHENGIVDSSFGIHGIIKTIIGDISLSFCSALQEDGKLLVAGVSDSGAFTIARYHMQSAPSSIQPNEIYSSDIVLYPNPVKDILQINVLEDKIVSIEIRDVSGRKIHLPLKEDTINVSSLPSGLYFIKIKTEKGELFGKFVKE